MDNSNRKYFSVNEIREMHRFFFEKVDLQSYNPTLSFEEPTPETVIEELIKFKLPLKRSNWWTSNRIERELLNPFV